MDTIVLRILFKKTVIPLFTLIGFTAIYHVRFHIVIDNAALHRTRKLANVLSNNNKLNYNNNLQLFYSCCKFVVWRTRIF